MPDLSSLIIRFAFACSVRLLLSFDILPSWAPQPKPPTLPPGPCGVHSMGQVSTVPDDLKPRSQDFGDLFLDLPGGYKMPQAGLAVCSHHNDLSAVNVRRNVLWYLLQGGRHVNIEVICPRTFEIDLGIKDALARGIPREQFFVSTHIWESGSYDKTGDVGYWYKGSTLENISKRIKRRLEQSGLEYLDLVRMKFQRGCMLSHAPKANCNQERWKMLCAMRAQGLVRNIGLHFQGNPSLEDLQNLSGAPIANVMILHDPWNQADKRFIQSCREEGISVSVFTNGLVNLESRRAVQALERKYKRSAAQILLRWSVQHGFAVTPGPDESPAQTIGNLRAISEFKLLPGDMRTIDEFRMEEGMVKSRGFAEPRRPWLAAWLSALIAPDMLPG